MNSRNGYAATATRWRGSVGNVNAGAELAATWCERRYVAAKIPEHCWTNCLRVVDFMRESLPEMASKSPKRRSRPMPVGAHNQASKDVSRTRWEKPNDGKTCTGSVDA